MRTSSRIAIVGIGGVYPESPTLARFWENIRRGVSTSRPVPTGRWLLEPADAYDRLVGKPDHVYSNHGCFIEDFRLDPQGINLDRDLLERLDPMVHLALHAARQALHSAKTAHLDRARIGVVIGNIALPTERSSALARSVLGRTFAEQVLASSGVSPENPIPIEPLARAVAGLPAGVLAQAFGLGGGAYTLDAACASSLYAVKLAADELLAGRADAMVTGGVSRPDCQYTQMGFAQLRALSFSGRCAPFDVGADGLVVGEGAGMFVLKRLEDALSAGDQIFAVIAGIGLSNDMHGQLLAPSSEGQLRAMNDAYAQASWAPPDIDLIECHGTGTPLGDAMEFKSLRALWGTQGWRAGQCVIGSVKSNIGHALTAAGAAGLLKVLLAFQENTLPPTANFAKPGSTLDYAGGPFRVLAESEPWKARAPGQPRRAAVSAFGFGGINAHVLLEEWLPVASPPPALVPHSVRKPSMPSPAIAIVGMGAHFGPWKTLDAFRERVLGGGPEVSPTALRHDWGVGQSDWQRGRGAKRQGFFIQELAVATDKYRIPPREMAEMLPQQLLMLDVSAAAIADAKFREDRLVRTGVFIGIELDLNTTNFHFRWSLLEQARVWRRQLGLSLTDDQFEAWVEKLREAAGPALSANRTMGSLGGIVASRIAREFRIGGPSFTIASEESSGLSALQVAFRLLQNGEIDQALVGAVDLAGDVRAILADAAGKYPSERILGEGAAALVLKRHADATKDDDRIYALLAGHGMAHAGGVEAPVPDPNSYRRALERAYENAGISEATVAYVETSGCATERAADVEEGTLAAFFSASSSAVPCALSSTEDEIGHAGAAAGLAALVKAVLCINEEILPPDRQRRTLGSARFQTLRASQYWLRNRADGPRRAGVSVSSRDGNCHHLVLEECPSRSNPRYHEQPLGELPESLFVVEGETRAELVSGLRSLREEATRTTESTVDAPARRWWAAHGLAPSKHLGLALVARDPRELLELIALAEARPDRASDNSRGSNDPAAERVFLPSTDLQLGARVAFVFPGSGNHFAGMGRDLSARWPTILRNQDRDQARLRDQLVPELFWNRDTVEEVEDHRALIFGQVALGTVVSDLLRGFGVHPNAAIGYSLGETAGLFALGAWSERDEMLRRTLASPLFATDLAGPCDAARAAWNLIATQAVDWLAGVVDVPADLVRRELAKRERVYLLIVNTPREAVIGGDRQAVQALVKDLGARFLPLRGVSTVHCPIVRQVEQAYRDLHLLGTMHPEGIDFYSGAWARPYAVDRDSAADSILAQARDGFDFPAVIESAYGTGVRIFVEIGPGASCSRMIGQILAGRPHFARSACVAGQGSVSTILRLLGSLVAARVPVDLSPLYAPARENALAHERQADASKILKIPLGGQPFQVPPLPENQSQPIASVSKNRSSMSAPPASERIAVDSPVLVGPFASAARQESASVDSSLLRQFTSAQSAKVEAHAAHLRFSDNLTQTMARQAERMHSLVRTMLSQPEAATVSLAQHVTETLPEEPPSRFPRTLCLEYAIGSIATVLGPEFAEADSFPTRVRLPAEPLMLVDRILTVEGEPRSLTSGRIVTEHDIHPGAWYLDGGCIPTCIAVEAGQADLFLSGYLGIDLHTRGLAVYRLLDAVVTFHRGLPGPGSVLLYDIHIDRFFRQGDTQLFRFRFECTVAGEPLLTMKDGCAGFFSEKELAAGRGIVHTELDRRPVPGVRPDDWEVLVPLGVEAYDDRQLEALRAGDLEGCFGPHFAGLNLRAPLSIPGGRMRLVDRVLSLDPTGGRYGLGKIRAEADIRADAWFLSCHFIDDQVMPGTLMYECCLHTLRIYLLRLGWVAEQEGVVCEPVPGVPGRLKCRGQVIATTRTVTYEVSIKELGYRPEPFAIVDALMLADGKPIVEITDMSLRLSGLTREAIRAVWQRRLPVPEPREAFRNGRMPALFDTDRILAFATGKPSEAFGAPYEIFDRDRIIARLPGPPYQFLDRITAIEAEPWKLVAGGRIEAQYDIPPDAWYFEANRQVGMSFAVLLEIALQPCGWLAAYLGSALTSPIDLSFRNLGGTAVQLRAVTPRSGTLTTKVTMTKVSSSGGMIIQNYDFEVSDRAGPVYRGDTYFGFFTKQALAQQVGIREAAPYAPSLAEEARKRPYTLSEEAPFPERRLRMLDRIDFMSHDGGTKGLGFVRGSKDVDPTEWFFQAHFHQDPVCPGSLGLESFLQLLKCFAADLWGCQSGSRFVCVALNQTHQWLYRGQVIPGNRQVSVEATITARDDAQRWLQADGLLSVDGRIIYSMKDFTLQLDAT